MFAVNPGVLAAGVGGSNKTYNQFVARITALAIDGSLPWRDTIGSLTGVFVTTAGGAGGYMSGSSWLSQFRGNNTAPSRAIQHGVDSYDTYADQIARGNLIFFEIQRTTYAPTTGLNRNGYLSLNNNTEIWPCVMPQLMFFDTERGPMRMQPSLGLGPEPYDW